MIELTRTNDPVFWSWLTMLLEEEDADTAILGARTAIVDRSISAIQSLHTPLCVKKAFPSFYSPNNACSERPLHCFICQKLIIIYFIFHQFIF